uniref:Uncharacterized protein n=1 Tax=Micrurus corallinus TaxID=54390 RepID=A0A2D4FPD0_MICCO
MGDSSSAVAMMPDRCYDSCAIKHHPVIQLTCTHLKAKVQNTLFWLSSISEMGVIQKYSRSFSLKLAFLKFSFQEKKYGGRQESGKVFLNRLMLSFWMNTTYVTLKKKKYTYIAIFQRMPGCPWFQCPDWIQT